MPLSGLQMDLPMVSEQRSKDVFQGCIRVLQRNRTNFYIYTYICIYIYIHHL